MPREAAMSAGTVIEERFRSRAEDRAIEWKRSLAYHDIGDRLMELRKEAWDGYAYRALWNIRPDATLGAMRSVAWALRLYGDMKAAFLAEDILQEVDRQENGDAA